MKQIVQQMPLLPGADWQPQMYLDHQIAHP
jgi:hypothetical protein